MNKRYGKFTWEEEKEKEQQQQQTSKDFKDVNKIYCNPRSEI